MEYSSLTSGVRLYSTFNLACSGGKPLKFFELQSDVIRAALYEHRCCWIVLDGVGVEVRVG